MRTGVTQHLMLIQRMTSLIRCSQRNHLGNLSTLHLNTIQCLLLITSEVSCDDCKGLNTLGHDTVVSVPLSRLEVAQRAHTDASEMSG